ncbi:MULTISPECIES: response regulator transcription factor [Actinomyces]|uniref:DNA-binding response regulator n=1 Tax=Actinomyces oris TaxID=544580 RepID=A0A1Q8VNQ7_9ACTO|nr:response regulator transcription factor [Actinomyces oris]OLO49703.1 DNA-binding response regulator [Actinomyces oris]
MIDVGIVDDDALVRHALTTLLNAQSDISVAWTASDGEEVIQLLGSPKNSSVQAILLDIQMPRMDGITLSTIVHKKLPNIAILILTTFINRELIDRTLAVGVNGYIAKEDSIESIAGAIRQAVGGNLVLSPGPGNQLRTRTPSTADEAKPRPTEETKAADASGPPELSCLSPREIEVLKLMIDALSNKQIARRLNVSEATVKTHVSTLIAKLGVHDRVGAVVKALRHGLA